MDDADVITAAPARRSRGPRRSRRAKPATRPAPVTPTKPQDAAGAAATADDLSRFCCQNERCVCYGTRGAGNLIVCDRVGKHRHIRLLRCRVCKKRFSERKGTVYYRSHTPVAKVDAILAHVQEGCGMRSTGRLVGVKEDTVIRYAKLAGRHAEQLHDELVAFSPSDRGGAVRREVELRRQEAAAL